jgi:hypothetical protein
MPVISDRIDQSGIMAGFHGDIYPAQPDCCRYNLTLTLKNRRGMPLVDETRPAIRSSEFRNVAVIVATILTAS